MTPNPKPAAEWVKSSYSSPEGGNCLEWMPSQIGTGAVPVRDSKTPSGPFLRVSEGAWSAFVQMAKNCER
ncbi:DUF397 domain-containing protein [Streptomyces pseudogriseolus]|uniref:DUF397 domain-containing protein n=1 Tax=Streptomyces pseudogriseolus TaxID=36817 RepID=UPI003FA204B5